MKTILKRSLVLFVLATVALSLFSCSPANSDVPDGMQLASADGAPFKLYVPKNWTLNKASGISGAYLSSDAGISVVVDILSADNAEQTLDEFVASAVEAYSKSYERFEITSEIGDTTLDGHAAKKVKFSLVYKDTNYRFMKVFAKLENDFVVFSYKARFDYFDRYLADAEEMLKVFKFSAKSDINIPKDEGNSPEGMKLASRPEERYSLYLPSSWVINSVNAASGGYVPEDRSNVSFTSYTPRESMSIDDYFNSCEKEYKSIYQNYTRESDIPDAKINEKLAKDYRFSFEYEGEQYRSRQLICIFDGKFYIFTYTAKADSYELHSAEVEKIISEIKFK